MDSNNKIGFQRMHVQDGPIHPSGRDIQEWSSPEGEEESENHNSSSEEIKIGISERVVRMIGISRSSIVTFSFSVNYVLGVGVLGIPWAFEQSGIFFAPILLFCVTIVSFLCIIYILETLARAQGIFDYRTKKRLTSEEENENNENVDEVETEVVSGMKREKKRKSKEKQRDKSTEDEENQRLLTSEDGEIEVKNEIREMLFEIPQLCKLFLPQKLSRLYSFVIVIYFILSLWSYASVFASSMSSNVPFPGINSFETCDIEDDDSHSSQCISLYSFWLLVFSLLVVPLTCRDLHEQIVVQVTLSIFRFVAMGLMLTTTLIGLYSYKRSDIDYDSDEPPYYSDAPYFDFSGFGKLLPIAVFSQLIHHSIPGLSKTAEKKENLPSIYFSVLCTTFTAYTLLGLVLALWYGSGIKETCTLNWTSYDAGYDKKPWWASLIAAIIILFPPIDLISAYPLNAITLGNNMLQIFVPKENQTKFKKIMFRLISSITPILGACLVRNLGTILRLSGSLGIIIAYFYPSLLWIYSYKLCVSNERPLPLTTPYTLPFFSNFYFVLLMGIMSIILFISVITFIFI